MGVLNNHPFPVEAHFDTSLVLGFAVPKEQLADRIPECLELDLFEDRWAFLAVAMVKTRGLRPKGFPKVFGRDFTLIGYRIFVRYRGEDGRRLRGLYILGSDTDRWAMRFLGGVFTRYRYRVCEISWLGGESSDVVEMNDGFRVSARAGDSEIPLPCGSPFSNWREARRFAGPMPFTFSYDKGRREVVIVEGVRSAWSPIPVMVDEWEIPFVNRLELDGAVLANAFSVANVPYEWRRGKIEKYLK